MKRFLGVILAIITLLSIFTFSTAAKATMGEYRLGELFNTGKDNGYSIRTTIGRDDPHYGWKIGEFFVTGFSRQVLNEDTPVFLKNAGDKITLWFDLQQDINALNGNDNLYICEDTNGYEETYKVEKQNLKKGALIIKHTDYQNKDGLSQTYIDFLSAKVSKDANTEVLLCEEGDYEVSLLYEIKEDNFLFFDSYYNYRIDFKFSVRNGNTMVFPFDVLTGQELTNNVFTENGFYIDLANSKYLNVDVKRESFTKGVNGLVKDTRYNRPAADGEKFTEEGIYTITVTNQYTNVTTEKKIYVGSNSLLKAHVVTGLSIEDISAKINDGKYEIDANGNIVEVSDTSSVKSTALQEKHNGVETVFSSAFIFVLFVGVLLIIAFLSIIFIRKGKKTKKSLTKNRNDSLEGK